MRKKKIKILHVAQAAGGVDRYIRMLLKYLDKEKFENILVCSQDFNREDYDGLVDSFEQIEMNRAIGVSDLNSIKEVRRLIKKYNPDIVYAHSSKAGAIARVADIGLKNHCVYNPHGWAFNMRCSDKKRAMYTAIEKMAAPFCEKIICISDAEKQSALEKKICREDKLQVIFNGVDIEAYESGEHGTVKRSSLGIPEDAYVVGMVGRISPQKAPDVFVKMAKLVKDEIPNAHFVIVGSGNQEAEIRKYSSKNEYILLPGSAIASIINVITNSILIPLYAQNGAVIASVMSELTTNIIQFLYLKRKIKYHISNTALVLSLFSTMVMAAVVCAIIKMNLPLAVALAMEISIGGAIYLLMNIALKNRILSEMLTKVLKKHNTGFQDS